MYLTEEGRPVPAVTAAQMREVDRIAVEEFGLGVLQMMENAGRNMAHHAMQMLGETAVASKPSRKGQVTILAGAGGNGGGGLCCARHLHNRGYRISLVLDRDAASLGGPAGHQLEVLQAAGLGPVEPSSARAALQQADLVGDALVGYSLRGAPRGRVAELIRLSNRHAAQVLSLDLPSGLDATTGEAPGAMIRPHRTLTLALPKTGLAEIPGELFLADIGIPPEVYHTLGLSLGPLFVGKEYWLRLHSGTGAAESS